jgi:hypothetical protein
MMLPKVDGVATKVEGDAASCCTGEAATSRRCSPTTTMAADPGVHGGGAWRGEKMLSRFSGDARNVVPRRRP